jgi:hypothetical protein
MWVIIGHGVGISDSVKERQQHSVGNLAAWLVNLDLALCVCVMSARTHPVEDYVDHHPFIVLDDL